MALRDGVDSSGRKGKVCVSSLKSLIIHPDLS